MALITLDRLSFGYRATKNVLWALTERITPGIWLLLGENGAGKTTLLSCMAGLLKPISGACLIDGVPTASHRPSVMERIFFLPDNLQSQQRNIAELKACDARFYPNFNNGLLDDNLKAFGLAEDIRLEKMSFGNRRKAFMAYALSLGTEVLLLDEPLNGLDIDSRKALTHMIARCVAPEQTVIVSTHEVHDLENLYDGIIVLHEGRILVCKPVDEIAAKVMCVRGSKSAPDALWSENSGGLCISLVKNVSGEPGALDYSVLYSALMHNHRAIMEILETEV